MTNNPFLAGLALAFWLPAALADFGEYREHALEDRTLTVHTTLGELRVTAVDDAAFEVHYVEDGIKQLPSFALDGDTPDVVTAVVETDDSLAFAIDGLSAIISKSPVRIDYLADGKELVSEEHGYFAHDTVRGFRFALDEGEKILGGGQRVLGMDRRGHRLPLYNKASYGYETNAEQMYYSVPAVLSTDKYMLVFDNSASGWLDIGHTESDVLTFEAVGGRTSYLVIAGATYPELIENYTDATGRQPLPPRRAFGNFASRFGYRNEAEARDVVRRFRREEIPLDTIILDIYWFGPDIKGHMGHLDWDRNAWPNPEKMIADFADEGIGTITVTEPFILTTSDRWNDAVANEVLAKTPTGEPRRFDFYFGNTGLIDVFDDNARDWFWQPYEMLFAQGMSGIWGDLGEPEVHPADALHWLSDAGLSATGDEVHNAFGHVWTRMVYERQVEAYPDERPLIMMRSGFAGTQRYGIVPWTGDVNRTWGGLKPQIELSLTMSLLGLAYTHSDLGGFAGGEEFDKELYLRWMQYGVFQPVYRPHAQEHIAPEPVFHDRETRAIARDFIELRYRLLPYVYTLAYENSTTGMPLMRPLFFEDESNPALIHEKDAYLWGDAFLVAPVMDPGLEAVDVPLPAGAWFDFWNGTRYDGDRTVSVPVSLETIPVLVRAGSFVPMAELVQTTRDYSSEKLTLHYFADASVPSASGSMYEDDGKTRTSLEDGAYELLNFDAEQFGDSLRIDLERDGGDYPGRPDERELTIVVHNWASTPSTVAFAGEPVEITRRMPRRGPGAVYDEATRELTVRVSWNHEPAALTINTRVEAAVKPVIYQVMTRLFGNTNTTNKPWGTIEENGVGKFADFTDEALAGIRELGTTHIWYTGVPHHAVVRDYTEFGISDDDPDVVKGRAGSPYAVKDYYSVNPDLAIDPAQRVQEFEALIERTHRNGMRVLIDIVPNHVARRYESLGKPAGVDDLGANDDTTVEWARDNNFYYVVNEDFSVPESPAGYAPLGGGRHPLADGEFAESPARWTGNGARAAQPRFDDWFETVKVNYGIRPDGSYAFDRLPDEARGWSLAEHAAFWSDKDVPDSWVKFRDIALYWIGKGVDGFRYDMAEMVPVEFWSYMNSAIKAERPDALLLAEVYNPDLYRDYIQLGRMDFLYDKVGLYDTLKPIVQGTESTDAIAPIHAEVADIAEHMLHFLENHDEQRIASPDFAGSAVKAKPAMVVSALLSRSPTMIYFGQDVGEPGANDAGFGDPTRTTIFDYWGVPAHQRWMNGGAFDGGQLSAAEQDLRDFYGRLLNLSATEAAFGGEYAEIHSHNREQTEGYDERLFSFVRWQGNDRVIVAANFDVEAAYSLRLQVPVSVISAWRLADGRYTLHELFEGAEGNLVVDNGAGWLNVELAPLGSVVLKVGDANIERLSNVASDFITARHVDVWLPDGYHDSTGTVDVIYAHDGQNLFNPEWSFYSRADWGIDETLQELIDEGVVDEAIVVGIWNTPKRRLEYLPQEAWDLAPEHMQLYIQDQEGGRPESREYLRFIVEELKPEIDRRYRTNRDRDDTFLLGSSMGGLVSLYGMIRYPDVFSAAACLSTHWPLHVDLNDIEATEAFIGYLESALPPPESARFYFDYGTEELDGRYEPHQALIDAMAAGLGYSMGDNWQTHKFEGAGHSEVYWKQRVDVPLTFLLADGAQ